MFGRQRQGAFVCRSCGRLVGVNDAQCMSCGAKSPALWGFAPALRKLGVEIGFAQLVMGICGALYIATLIADPAAIGGSGMMSFLSPGGSSLLRFGASGGLPVFGYGRWWTVFSAGWLHGGLMHIVFNLLWIRQLGPLMVEAYGTARTILIYTLASAVGFTASTFGSLAMALVVNSPAGLTVGASAGIFGLLGALVHFSRRGGASALGREVWGWAAFLFVFGLIASRVDNWAHFGGFVGGYLASRIFDPLKPERLDHIAGAVVCLLVTVAAIVASLLIPIPL